MNDCKLKKPENDSIVLVGMSEKPMSLTRAIFLEDRYFEEKDLNVELFPTHWKPIKVILPTRLKTVFQEGFDRFNEIGGDFEIFNKKENKEEFDYYFKDLFPKPELNDQECVFAILKTPEILIPLYKVHRYYVMNNDGSTFLNLSFKDGLKALFNKSDLTSFGNYLLSEERKERYKDCTDFKPEELADRLSSVHKEDFYNWQNK